MRTYINPDFSISYGYTPLKNYGVDASWVLPRWIAPKSNSERCLFVNYRGVGIAMFRPEEGRDLKKDANDWIRTHGYLAEWTRLKHMTGEKPSWEDSMFVHVVYEEQTLKIYKSLKEALSDGPMDAIEYRTQFPSPRYQVFVEPNSTKLICIDTKPQHPEK